MEAPRNIQIAWLNLLSGALWPLVLVFAIGVFGKQINALLVALAAQFSSITSFELGGVKLTIAARDFPPAPERIAQALSSIDSEMLQYIVAVPEDPQRPTWINHEYAEPDTPHLKPGGLLVKLRGAGLIDFQEIPTPSSSGGKGGPGRQVRVTFNNLFWEVRSYYFQVLQALRFSKSKS